MTVDASAQGDTGDAVPPPPPAPPTLGGPAAPPAPAVPVALVAPPQPGELTQTWRLVTALGWFAVVVALGAVWRTSDQLGMSTWWLGPRGAPHPVVVQLLPFVPAVVMVLACGSRTRHVPWLGVVCAALTAAVGVVDLGVMTELGWVEIAIGAAALLLSLASRAGTYRPATPPPVDA